MCPCIQEPTMRVCVDEVETGMAELCFMLKEILRRSQQKRNTCCQFCINEDRKKNALGAGK